MNGWLHHIRPYHYVQTAALFAVSVGAVVVVGGWGLDIAALRSGLPGLATMKINTALGLAAAGAALWLAASPVRGAAKRIGRVCATVAAGIGLLTLTEYLAGWNLAIDQLLFSDPDSVAAGAPPGRPAPNTALALLLLGTALLLVDYTTPRGRRPAEGLALAAGLISYVALLGYGYGVESLYAMELYSSMSLPTVLVACLLAVGIFCARPTAGLMSIITADSAGGYIARRLIPAALVVPPLVAGVRLAGERAGYYGFEFGLALHTTINVVVFAVLVSLSAVSLHRVDTRRRRAEQALRDANEVLEARVEERTAAMQREVDERKRLEKQFRGLFESAPDAVIICNGEGVITLANAQAEVLFGYARDELIGLHVEVLVPARLRAAHVHHRADYAREPHTRAMGAGMELHARRKSGEEFPVGISLSVLATESGPLVVSDIRDVTRDKQAEREIEQLNDDLLRRTVDLEAANRELEAFSYSVSHDLRAPLRALDGFSQALLEDYHDRLDDEGRDYLRRVRGAAQRMGSLIDDLLKLSRVARTELNRDQVDISAIAATIASELQQTEPHRSAEFAIAEGLVAQADGRLLRVALENLLNNAWKFTRPRQVARIEFGVTHRVEETSYFVRDNGVGFDMAYSDKLFSAFQRLHDAREFPGTGIGLATAQRVIHKHGGRIWAESEKDNGAVFRFTL